MHNKRKYIREVYKFYDLFRVVENVIPIKEIEKHNKTRSWQYGYNEEYDVIIISKDGTVGDIYEIENLYIALPAVPDIKTIDGYDLPQEEQKWIRKELPADLAKYKTNYGKGSWEDAPIELKEKYAPYIHEEYRRRFEGYWFMNNGIPTYLTGSNYMYLQWSPIDVGYADFWLASMITYYHWEACKADKRCYGQVKVKCRRSGWSHEASSDLVDTVTIHKRALCGIISKTGDDAQSFFTDKSVMKYRDYPFFFKPLQDGSTNPKQELAFRSPSERITSKRKGASEEDEGLESRLNWKNTANNSYDSEKLKLIVEDESGKWASKLGDLLVHWRRIKPTLRTGIRIVGKCKMGTTVNPKGEGGGSFEKLWNESNPLNRLPNGETTSGLYQIFIRAEHNYEGFIDQYGYPVLENPEKPVKGLHEGEWLTQGAFEYFDAHVESLRNDPSGLNDFLRENPRQIEHAFREPAIQSPFVVANIYDQIEHNKQMIKVEQGGGVIARMETQYNRYNLKWIDGRRDTKVEAIPDPNGRFYCSWIPPKEAQNNIEMVGSLKTPGNKLWGAFGCDPYDISQTNRKDKQSKGALVGISRGRHMGGTDYGVFLEYLERPYDSSEFFDDVIKACVFFGMPILPERDKPRLLYEMKERGYRKYVMNRPDKAEHEIANVDLELGGYPGGNKDIARDQILLMADYTQKHLSIALNDDYRIEGTYPVMPFNRLLNDMAIFDPTNRTKSDLTIAFGAAILAIQSSGFYARSRKEVTTINIGLTPINTY